MLYIGIIVFIFLVELGIKNRIDHTFEKKEIFKGKIIIQKYKNKGACMNLLSKHSKFVAIISVIFSLCIFIYFLFSLGNRGNVVLRIGLAFLLGGAFSNTYDRLKRKYVVDYFSFHSKSKKLNAIVFNLADFCVLIGAMLTAIAS
jgi:signal peptidase II